MEEVRGRIIYRDRKRQIITFENVRYGKITPTDIDGSMDYHGDVFCFIEVKYGDAKVKRGQKEHLRCLVDRLHEAGCEAVAVVVQHDVANPEEDVDVASCIVREEYFDGEWRQCGTRTLKDFIDGFFAYAEQRKGRRNKIRKVIQLVSSLSRFMEGA